MCYNRPKNENREDTMKQNVAVKMTIGAICFVNLMYMIPSVAVSGMVAAFPQYNESTVLLLLTLPNLTGIVGIVTEPLLERWFSRRQLSLAALLLFFAMGMVSWGFHTNLPVFIAASAAMGAAYGMQSTVFPLLVSGYFEGEERNQVMGFVTGMLQLGRVAATLVGGILADLQWYYIYACFLLVLVPFVAGWLVLPRNTKQPQQQGVSSQGGGYYIPQMIRLSAVGFAFAALYYVVNTHLSLYVEGYQLGGASVTGVITAVGSVLAGGISTCFAWIQRYTRRFTMAVALCIMGVGYLVGGLWIGLPGVAFCMLGASAAMGLFSPCLMLGFAHCATAEKLPTATAIVLTIVNVGYFASPYLTGWAAGFLGSGAAVVFLVAGVLAMLCAACSWLVNLK